MLRFTCYRPAPPESYYAQGAANPPDEPQFDGVAEERSKKLVEAHERFSALMGTSHFQVVYPVLPMDILGVYILLPDGGQN